MVVVRIVLLVLAMVVLAGFKLVDTSKPVSGMLIADKYATFCGEYPEARCDDSGPELLVLTAEHMAVMKKVQGEVNSEFPYSLGEPGPWKILKKGQTGMCADIAVTKRHRLIESGFPPNALSLAVVVVTVPGPLNGSLHMVLLVNTDQGMYVLDSLAVVRIARWDEWPFSDIYSWGMRSQGSPDNAWTLIGVMR